MSLQPEPSTQEVLAGLVERVTYHNAENGFCVLRARARGHRDLVTVVGQQNPFGVAEFVCVLLSEPTSNPLSLRKTGDGEVLGPQIHLPKQSGSP